MSFMNSPQTVPSCTDILPIGILVLSADGIIGDVNPAARDLVEAPSGDMLRGKPFQNIVAPEFRSAFLALLRNVAGGHSDSLEFQITGLNGTRRWLEARAVPLPAAGAEGAAVLATCQDISERYHREGRNRYNQKMDAVATLASSVAHDFNNILTSIVGYAHILKMKLPGADPLRPCADRILDSIDRATDLTKGLLSFGSKQILTLAPVGLSGFMERLISSLSQEMGPAIHVRADSITAEPVTLMADESQLQHAFLQIARNARDAMPSGGRLTLSVGVMEIEDTFISIHGYGSKGGYAVFTLVDTGAGMDDQVRRKAFEPFFTTKESGKGLGLGLAIVYGIIKSHRGFVNIYSEPGIGTTVRVYLPVSGFQRPAEEFPEDRVPEGRGETILFADDDADFRLVMSALLEEFGYKVLQAANGAEAKAAFEGDPGGISLALLDAAMPSGSGREVAEAIARTRPSMRFLFLSGLPPDIVRDRGLVRSGDPCLTKPVSPRDLLFKIREVLP